MSLRNAKPRRAKRRGFVVSKKKPKPVNRAKTNLRQTEPGTWRASIPLALEGLPPSKQLRQAFGRWRQAYRRLVTVENKKKGLGFAAGQTLFVYDLVNQETGEILETHRFLSHRIVARDKLVDVAKDRIYEFVSGVYRSPTGATPSLAKPQTQVVFTELEIVMFDEYEFRPAQARKKKQWKRREKIEDVSTRLVEILTSRSSTT